MRSSGANGLTSTPIKDDEKAQTIIKRKNISNHLDRFVGLISLHLFVKNSSGIVVCKRRKKVKTSILAGREVLLIDHQRTASPSALPFNLLLD